MRVAHVTHVVVLAGGYKAEAITAVDAPITPNRKTLLM